MCSMNWLDHPHSLEGVDGDRGVAALDLHTADPLSEAHLPDESGDTGTSEYDSYPQINCLMVHSEDDLISG